MPNVTTDPPSLNQEILEPLRRTLDSISAMPALTYEDLVVIPLASGTAKPDADYPTLADLPDATPDTLTVEELGFGSVPTVQAKVGLHPLVVFAGESIVGGKQNRVINVTVWLPQQTTTPIPVTCLEHGRWDSGRYFAAGAPIDLDMRARVAKGVNQRGSFASDQGEVWREISRKEELAQREGFARSKTAALHDVYAATPLDLEAAYAALPMPAGACGLAVGVGGRLVGLDLFDSTATLARQWRRFISSAAFAAVDHRRKVAAGMLDAPERMAPDDCALGRLIGRAKLATDSARVRPSVGSGWDVRLTGPRVHGSALVNADRVVHLALFRDGELRPMVRLLR